VRRIVDLTAKRCKTDKDIAAMNVLLFGSSGMVGQGVLRECLIDPRVARVVTVVRRSSGNEHPKLSEIILGDLLEIDRIESKLEAIDASMFCVGVSSAGLSQDDYTRLTYDLTFKVATLISRLFPESTFIYVSGAGADSSEHGRFMWARVKGRTENAIRNLPFGASYMFRPGAIQPLHGIRSKTLWYRIIYAATGPLYPLLLRLFPGAVTTTEQLGRAMIDVAARGYKRPILETSDINRVG
jgi:uncharacterized protein YbjT (DUF2867 family)